MKNVVVSCNASAGVSLQDSASAGSHYRVSLLRQLRRASLLLLSLCATAAIAASSLSKVVDGVTIYVGIVPAQITRGQPMEHASGGMHGGATKGEQYHVLVVLLDAKTGQRIIDAEVEASVAEFGKTGPAVTLSLMKIAESVTYGNYFDLPGSGPFRIDLKIRRPNVSHVIQAQFEHAHP